MTKSCRPVRIMSIRKHSIPQFNAYFCESNSGDGSTLLMTNLVDACESCRFVNFEYPILTMDFRPFHALRTWKVHVFIYSFHQATHFHTLVTPLEFWYVFQHTIRLPVYHATYFQTLLTTLHFRYVNRRFDFRCVDLSMTVYES